MSALCVVSAKNVVCGEMSLKKPTLINIEGKDFKKSSIKSSLKWNNSDFDDENGSISSEEEEVCGSGNERFRPRPMQEEIWSETEILAGLQSLAEADEIIKIINSNETELLKEHKNALMTAMLIASWFGNEKALKIILEDGQSCNELDNEGRSALHLAAYAGNTSCLKILIEHDTNLNIWDYKRKATPLHCAASKNHLECLKILIESGADINAGITTRTALHYAVQNLAVECVEELLRSGANPNIYQIFSETPLHVAASLGRPDIIKLLLDYGASVHCQSGQDKSTPLHLAAEDGDYESARLLIESGADVNAANYKLQTPLHLAALSQSVETLELLLKNKATPNVKDCDGRTPLHCAIVKISCYECVRLLLNSGAGVNTPDAFGYTPLHLAALNEFSHCVMLLINYGGDVTARTNGGISVLTFITRRTPDVIPKYKSKFDAAITVNDHEIGDVDCEIKLDFRILVPTIAKGETELLLNFIEAGHREVLKHPLCETFLFLKWRRIRKFFLFSLFYHTLFVLLYTGYIIGVFLKDCPSLSARGFFNPCTVATYIKVMGFALIILNFMLLGKEIFQIAHSWFTYIKQWENWLQWLIIASVFCCVYPSKNMDIRHHVEIWQHHVAAIGIFLAWLELMMIVGRFPIFGLYVQMFTTVAMNFSKFLLAYLCLLIAFSLSFGVLFANYPPFHNLIWGLLKTLIMMSGELEFEDIFYGDYEVIYPVTAHIIFLIFVLLVTIILTNLMVGLAVSDIQGLQQSAGLDRLVRQAELVAHLESMLFSRLLRCFPRQLLAFFYRYALLVKSHYQWALYIKPNDPREERIPKDLIKSIYQLVVERKDKPRNKRCSQKSQKRSCNVSRLNSNNSNCIGIIDSNRNQTNMKVQIEEIQREFFEHTKIIREKLENLQNRLNNTCK